MGYDLSVAMWGLLIAGGSVIVALIFLAIVSLTTREPKGPDPKLLRAEADELAAHAAAAYAKAGRAAAAAEQARTAANAAEEARDEAWRAQEIADAAYDAARKDVEDAAAEIAAAAAAQAAAEEDGADDEDSDERDRTVSRAALGAYKRGEISVEELRDVFRVATTDQSPLRSERERVAYRYQTEQRAARRIYDRAATAARAADEAARIAEIAAIALAEEAAEAAAEAHEAMLLARQHADGRRRR